MRALSLHQPWASLIAVEAKRIETRSWATNYRGWVAIHAATRWTEAERSFLSDPAFREPLAAHYQPDDGEANWLPLGAFIALARLAHMHSTNDKPLPAQGSAERKFGDYSRDRFMWVFDDVVPLDRPLSARGQQGLWRPTEAECAVFNEHIARRSEWPKDPGKISYWPQL